MALVRGCGRRKLRGAGFMDFINNVGNFFKKSGIISKVGNALSSVGVPYAGQVANIAGHIGLGRRRRYKGGRRRLQGGSLIGTFLSGLLSARGRRHRLQGGSAHPRTAQLLDINPPRTRIARLRKAF